MLLDQGPSNRVRSKAVALSEKVTTPFGISLEANEAHDVRGKGRELPRKRTIAHLMPYVVHGVKLHATALVPVSEDKEVH